MVALLTLAAQPATALDQDKTLELGRRWTQAFYAGQIEDVWGQCTEQMQAALGSETALRQFHQQIQQQLGKEKTLVAENVESAGGMEVYSRTVIFQKSNQQFHVQWVFDKAEQVAGFVIRPAPKAAPSKFLEYKTKTDLRLPFEDQWFVFWGGREVAQNYHAATTDQRFAYDILMMKNKVSHRGDGKRNEDYYCFAQPVLAPGDGRVHATANDIPDNIPGEMNPRQALGNHVIIEHGNGEFSFLAHFKQGSVQVEPGDLVKAGQRLGLCGNSGNSSEPHIHYHLQTTREFGKGLGLPAQFQHYRANGKDVSRGEPVRGQVISPVSK